MRPQGSDAGPTPTQHQAESSAALHAAAMSAPSDPASLAPTADAVAIDVCVCTFQRSTELARLLESLAAQETAPRFRVLVADNHAEPVEAAHVELLARQLALDVRYLHAPAANISIARNACLDHATAAFVAFIDDDETAAPDWLAQLSAAMPDADAVFGRVQAQYDADAPAWARAGDFHSKLPAQSEAGACGTGHTANVMIRRDSIGARRFDPALGRSGGEDTLFFALLRQDGARLRVAPAALVHEPVEHTRANLRWLARRACSSGQTHARMLRATGRAGIALAPLSALKLAYCLLAVALTAGSAVRWRRNLLRACLHLGVLSRTLGTPDLELYGKATS